MKRPLRAITVSLLIIAILLQSSSLFTGAATTQSFVTILAPVTPPAPGPAPAPGVGPGAPGVPAEMPVQPPVQKAFYIGDFAVNRLYTVDMGVDEIWAYTYKGENHTLKLVYLNKDSTEFEHETISTHLKIFTGQTIQIDADKNGYSDVKITVNSIANQRANVTLEIDAEKVLFEEIKSSNLIYLILALLALLVMDTLIHHRKEKQIFRHVWK